MGSLLAHHGLFTTRFNPHVILLKRDSERRLALEVRKSHLFAPKVISPREKIDTKRTRRNATAQQSVEYTSLFSLRFERIRRIIQSILWSL